MFSCCEVLINKESEIFLSFGQQLVPCHSVSDGSPLRNQRSMHNLQSLGNTYMTLMEAFVSQRYGYSPPATDLCKQKLWFNPLAPKCTHAIGQRARWWTSPGHLLSVLSSMLCPSLSLHTSAPGQLTQPANQSFTSIGQSSQNTGLTMSALLITLQWLPISYMTKSKLFSGILCNWTSAYPSCIITLPFSPPTGSVPILLYYHGNDTY